MPSTSDSARARRVTADPRWALVRARDRAASFFFSVKTTGVFCRPSCASRAARPENVAFHATFADAVRAGFRPCKRCRPGAASADDAVAKTIAEVCRFIEESEEAPSLAALAERSKMSAYHLHRVFKRVTGVTPRAYAAGQRAKRAARALTSDQSVTAAIYDAGYGSSSRFYETSKARLGMTPTELRRGGATLRITWATARSSLGWVLVGATERGVCAILLGDDRAELARDFERRFPKAERTRGDEGFDATVARVVAMVEHPETPAALPLDIRGTAFQERVWKALTAIAPGKRATYTEIARAIGAPDAVRAVAGACAANAIAIAIPCHRVVRADGGMAGYRWGVERKKVLLEREGRGR